MVTIDNTAQLLYPANIAKRVFANFSWSIASEAIGKGIFFISNIYLARTLGVDTFGVFTLAMTITYCFWLAVDLGSNMYGIREISKDKVNVDKIVNPLLTLRITAGIFMFLIYSCALYFIDIPVINKLTFAGCALYLLTYALYSDWVLKGLEKFKYIAVGNLVSSVAFLIGAISFVRGSEKVVYAAFAWSLSYLLGSISLMYFLFKKFDIKFKLSFDVKTWLIHLKESIYFTLSGGLMMIYHYLPVLLIAIYCDNHELGVFSAPYRLVIVVGSAGFLLPMAVYPIFSELFVRDKSLFHRTHRKFQIIMAGLGLPVAVIGMIFSERIIEILFGKQYHESIVVLKILVWLVPLLFLRYTYGSVLLATGYHRQQYLAAASGVIGMFFFGLIFVHKAAAVGGALAFLIAEVIMLVSMAVLSFFTFKKGQWI